jgi:hypothetical protein
MDQNITPIIVAVIGAFQVALAIYFARRNNEAVAQKDESDATVNIGSSYSTLVITLEGRLTKVEEKYDKLCDEYETDKLAWVEERSELTRKLDRLTIEHEKDKIAWAAERFELVAEIARLETLIDSK